MRTDEPDVEALARPEVRARLSPWRVLRLYLDPFGLFKDLTAGPAALQYNRERRHMLLTYLRRWAVIGGLCLTGMVPLGARAATQPVLFVPIVGLELGFSTAMCMLFFILAAYVVLGLER
jgi:hypothetical protein